MQTASKNNRRMEQLFRWLVSHPKRIIAASLAIIVLLGANLGQLEKDTRSDAFLADNNPALLYRDKVKEVFGLSDPIVIAVVSPDTIFTTEGLDAVRRISHSVANIDNIDPEGVTSLATENNIIGTEEGMEVTPFISDDLPLSEQAEHIRNAIRNFPLYQGTLVALDEKATLIVAETLDQSKVETTYQSILSEIKALDLDPDLGVHVAGEGAIAGYLGSYIDSDAKRLNPLAALIITLIVWVAFRRLATTIVANIIIGACALTTFGAMAASGVPFFVITNALPVILIGIAVADSIHIYSEYFERRAHHQQEEYSESIVASMLEMWRPITLTTLTTAAGFMGLYFAAYMPPFKFFGLFAAIGVSIAWLFSLLLLPAVMAMLKTEVSPSLASKLAINNDQQKRDVFASTMVQLGKLTLRFPIAIVVLSLLVIAVGLVSSLNLVVNEDRIETFHSDETLYIADQVINEHFYGTHNLDIVIETPAQEGLFDPAVLKKMEALQTYAETLPYVQGSVSVVDYLKQMNQSLNQGDEAYYSIPDNADLVAQYFLLYATSGNPSDFEEEVDYDYRLANIRVILNEGAYKDNKQVVEALEHYLMTEFNSPNLKGNLSGRVNLSYHWIKDIGQSHFFGMAIALALVWLVSALLFRSATAGLFALIPVATSILFVYSAMVFFEIGLGIGTSMFSAVAIGLGVDFAVHTIDRVKNLYRQHLSIEKALNAFYPSTGRALLFNLLAISFGFGVLISSKVVPLNNFGTIVALSVSTSFLVSMTLLPALILLFKPRFVTGQVDSQKATLSRPASLLSLLLVVVLLGGVVSTKTVASELPDGRWVAEQINNIDEGETRISRIEMILTDRRGKERVRDTLIYRKYFGSEKRTALFYLSPRNIKDTGFLSYDYADANTDDDQWLYLPALRKSRRISASDRGDYFLGTDLTYEDMKKEGKLELNDYQFETLARQSLDGSIVLQLQAIPLSSEIAKELGYSKVHAWVNPENWIILKAKYWDTNGNELKTLQVKDIRKVDGIWTRHHLSVNNHKTGHQTVWKLSSADYKSEINDHIFTRNALTRGAPR